MTINDHWAAKLFDSELAMSELRTKEILPPQGYRYLTAMETTSLIGT